MHNQSEATPLLVSIDAAARLLGISPKTIRNQASRGVFPIAIVKLGGRALLRLTDIHTFAAAPVVAAPNPAKRGRGRPRKMEGGAK